MSRALALAALLSGLLSGQENWRAAIARQSWDPLDRRYAEETIAALQRLKSTRGLLAFVKRHGIDLVVEAPGGALPENALGCYVDDERRIYMNKEDLMKGVQELRRKGTPEDAIPGVLAWKFLPTVVHEIRHGLTRQRLRERGLNVRLSPLESETISFLEEAVVFREEVQARPKLWADHSEILEVEESTGHLLQALDKDVGEVKVMVGNLYGGKASILDTPREGLVAEYRRRLDVVLARADELLRLDASELGDSAVAADFEDFAWSLAEAIHLYREMLAVLESPDAYARYRRFYQEELAAVARVAQTARRVSR